MGKATRLNGAIQNFGSDRIATASAGVAFDVSDIKIIRIAADSEYFINTDSANKADMLRGCTSFFSEVDSVTFTNDTVMEIWE